MGDFKVYYPEIGKFVFRYNQLMGKLNQKQEEYQKIFLKFKREQTTSGSNMVSGLEAEFKEEIKQIEKELLELKVEIKPFIPILQQNRQEIILRIKKMEPKIPTLNKIEEENEAIINSLRARQKNLDETRAEVVAMCTSKEFKRNYEKLQDKRTYLGLLHNEEILQEIEEFVTGKVANVSTISKSK